MKEIQLLSLTLDHFKGQDHLDLDFEGRSATIYGDNAAGKTTVYDALTWLLFGKDSRGQSSFEIKPLGADGQIKDHGAVTSVEARFRTADGVRALRKTFFEKWSTKRGQADKTFDGNTSEYYVDGVPSKKYEFEARVADLVDEEQFRLLTSVTYFCTGMSWQDRRKILFEVSDVATDSEILAHAPQFSPLATAMGRLTLSDYKKKLTAERRGLNGARDSIPARLDECQKTIQALEGINFSALEAERDRRAEKRAALQAELLKLEHNTLLDSKVNELNAIRNQMTGLDDKNKAYRQGQVVTPTENAEAVREEIRSLEHRLSLKEGDQKSTEAEIGRYEALIQECRARWIAANAEGFTGASCPTCGRPLSDENLATAQAQFEAQKEQKLALYVNDAERAKQRVVDWKARLDESRQEADDIRNELSALRHHLATIQPVVQPEILDLPDYAATRAGLEESAAALEAVITSLRSESSTIQADTKSSIDALSDEIRVIEGEIAKRSMLDYARDRMEALRAEAREAAGKLEAVDQMLYLCDEFTRYKVQYIEDSINHKFRLVTFRLFSEQINGGLADCCDPMVDGVPYGSLNNGARINVGMDVIATLSEHYGIRVPLFVDNAEGVTALLPVDTQVIRLVVSESDQKLRCEYGA